MANVGKVLLLFLAGMPVVAVAQQYPHYTMYMANNFILNPALAGIESYADLRLAARSQWTGITDAPKTAYATLSLPMPGRDSRKSRIGIGGKVFLDQTGPISLSSAEVDAAYHLSAGVRGRGGDELPSP